MGTSPTIHLWTVRYRNNVATTTLLKVFTQRNFAAEFRQKLNFTSKNRKNRILCHPLGVLSTLGHTVYLWIIGKRVVDFLLMLIKHFLLALIMVEAL